MDELLKCDFMVKRAQMKAKLLRSDNYKGRWFKLTKHWLYYCDGKPEVMLHVSVHLQLSPRKHEFYAVLNNFFRMYTNTEHIFSAVKSKSFIEQFLVMSSSTIFVQFKP